MNYISTLLFLFLSITAQERPYKYEGLYQNTKYPSYIKIDKNAFIYILDQGDAPIYFTDTLAICKYKVVDKQFLEINSEPSIHNLAKGLVVNQEYDPLNTKTVFRFFFPSQSKYHFRFRYYNKDYDVIVRSGETVLAEANLVGKLPSIISIEPAESFRDIYSTTFNYYDVELHIERKPRTNVIEYHIPSLDDSFFERYVIEGEYVRFLNDKLIWRGMEFIRVK